MAISLLPIDSNSLIYGSNNAGLDIRVDPTFNEMISKCCSCLNLGERTVAGGTKVRTPIDLEGHKGSDGRYYVIYFLPVFFSFFVGKK